MAKVSDGVGEVIDLHSKSTYCPFGVILFNETEHVYFSLIKAICGSFQDNIEKGNRVHFDAIESRNNAQYKWQATNVRLCSSEVCGGKKCDGKYKSQNKVLSMDKNCENKDDSVGNTALIQGASKDKPETQTDSVETNAKLNNIHQNSSNDDAFPSNDNGCTHSTMLKEVISNEEVVHTPFPDESEFDCFLNQKLGTGQIVSVIEVLESTSDVVDEESSTPDSQTKLLLQPCGQNHVLLNKLKCTKNIETCSDCSLDSDDNTESSGSESNCSINAAEGEINKFPNKSTDLSSEVYKDKLIYDREKDMNISSKLNIEGNSSSSENVNYKAHTSDETTTTKHVESDTSIQSISDTNGPCLETGYNFGVSDGNDIEDEECIVYKTYLNFLLLQRNNGDLVYCPYYSLPVSCLSENIAQTFPEGSRVWCTATSVETTDFASWKATFVSEHPLFENLRYKSRKSLERYNCKNQEHANSFDISVPGNDGNSNISNNVDTSVTDINKSSCVLLSVVPSADLPTDDDQSLAISDNVNTIAGNLTLLENDNSLNLSAVDDSVETVTDHISSVSNDNSTTKPAKHILPANNEQCAISVPESFINLEETLAISPTIANDSSKGAESISKVLQDSVTLLGDVESETFLGNDQKVWTFSAPHVPPGNASAIIFSNFSETHKELNAVKSFEENVTGLEESNEYITHANNIDEKARNESGSYSKNRSPGKSAGFTKENFETGFITVINFNQGIVISSGCKCYIFDSNSHIVTSSQTLFGYSGNLNDILKRGTAVAVLTKECYCLVIAPLSVNDLQNQELLQEHNIGTEIASVVKVEEDLVELCTISGIIAIAKPDDFAYVRGCKCLNAKYHLNTGDIFEIDIENQDSKWIVTKTKIISAYKFLGSDIVAVTRESLEFERLDNTEIREDAHHLVRKHPNEIYYGRGVVKVITSDLIVVEMTCGEHVAYFPHVKNNKTAEVVVDICFSQILQLEDVVMFHAERSRNGCSKWVADRIVLESNLKDVSEIEVSKDEFRNCDKCTEKPESIINKTCTKDSSCQTKSTGHIVMCRLFKDV